MLKRIIIFPLFFRRLIASSFAHVTPQARSLQIDNAITALENSLKWNPVNVGSLFEIAEINRLRGKDDVYYNVIRNT